MHCPVQVTVQDAAPEQKTDEPFPRVIPQDAAWEQASCVKAPALPEHEAAEEHAMLALSTVAIEQALVLEHASVQGPLQLNEQGKALLQTHCDAPQEVQPEPVQEQVALLHCAPAGKAITQSARPSAAAVAACRKASRKNPTAVNKAWGDQRRNL